MSQKSLNPYDPTTQALASLIDALTMLDDELYARAESTKPSMTSLGSTEGPLFDTIQELEQFFGDSRVQEDGLSYLVANFARCEKSLQSVRVLMSTNYFDEVADHKLLLVVRLRLRRLELRVKRSTASQLLLQEHLMLLVKIGPSYNRDGAQELYGDLIELRDRYFTSGTAETLTEYRSLAELTMQTKAYKVAKASRLPKPLALRERRLEECSISLEVASMMEVLN